ncbi:hypothetical protein Lalb_Chr07g0189451 [Lupinus albus]|uniref:Uncharacterized protein n=1 Tax=Lupinus albus TaxID=3870 RepID=A0A6A4QB29_LUPAL|nr:hypothetical protein Lalb_Chr07g0189451 [Lupinus albus]
MSSSKGDQSSEASFAGSSTSANERLSGPHTLDPALIGHLDDSDYTTKEERTNLSSGVHYVNGNTDIPIWIVYLRFGCHGETTCWIKLFISLCNL